jgi:hypothetical protein
MKEMQKTVGRGGDDEAANTGTIAAVSESMQKSNRAIPCWV